MVPIDLRICIIGLMELEGAAVPHSPSIWAGTNTTGVCITIVAGLDCESSGMFGDGGGDPVLALCSALLTRLPGRESQGILYGERVYNE
jgi:hypothetical protein